MELIARLLLFLHIAVGCAALLSGLAAIIFRNNVKKHRPFGKIYFWCMTIIFFTAFYISLYKQNWFLFFINIFSYHSCFTGYRSLKLKQIHKGQKPAWYDWAVEILHVAANLVLISLGILLITQSNTQFGIISITFAVLGLRISSATTKRLRNKLKGKNYWLLSHIGDMLGSYIGAITAFLVNNNRWIGMPQIIAWLGPAVVLIPLIFYEVNRFKKKEVINA
jgi:hypothetical protein